MKPAATEKRKYGFCDFPTGSLSFSLGFRRISTVKNAQGATVTWPCVQTGFVFGACFVGGEGLYDKACSANADRSVIGFNR